MVQFIFFAVRSKIPDKQTIGTAEPRGGRDSLRGHDMNNILRKTSSSKVTGLHVHKTWRLFFFLLYLSF